MIGKGQIQWSVTDRHEIIFHKGTHAASNFVWTIKTKDGITRDFDLNIQPSLANGKDVKLIRNDEVLDEGEVVPVLDSTERVFKVIIFIVIVKLSSLRFGVFVLDRSLVLVLSVIPGLSLTLPNEKKKVDGTRRSEIWILKNFGFREPLEVKFADLWILLWYCF